MNNVFRAKFSSWQMILSLSPRELAYEIALGMNEKMGMARHANVNWDVNNLAEGIASGYTNTPDNRRIVMEGIEMMFAMGLLTESVPMSNRRSMGCITRAAVVRIPIKGVAHSDGSLRWIVSFGVLPVW